MKPRIFISSTCYDLKFVREDLADFIRGYNYEPILSENGDVGYTPGQNLDKSCYSAIRTADMIILIIGCEYGSAASGETKDEFEEYISITRNEFRTVLNAGIPIFAMIDKKVMAEYGIYEENIDEIEKKSLNIKFRVTRNINIFRFIKEIKNSVTLPIQEFEKSADIKGFISKQWADMFKNYLNSLRTEKEDNKIENSVNEMKALIQKMDIMLDSVGKNVLLKENPEEYEEIITQQEIISFCNSLIKILNFTLGKKIDTVEKRKKFVSCILECLKENKMYKNFHDELFELLHYRGYEVGSISSHNTELNILSKSDLLQDPENYRKILENLSTEKCFNDLVKYELE